MLNNLEEKIIQLKNEYQVKYGFAVFDIEVKKSKKSLAIKGIVLTEKQRDEVLDLANLVVGTGLKPVPTIKIKILSDARQRNEIGWAVVKNKVVDLKSRFVSSKILNEKILKRIRCSQALKDEILRVLYKNEDQLLVQQNDLTLGWVNRSEVILKKKSLLREWRRGNFAVKGKTISLNNCHPELVSGSVVAFKKSSKIKNKRQISKQPMDIIIKEAEKYLGAKYVFGGKSEKGIDCSGLIQVAYKNSLGVILPKHSWDQKEMGKRVKLKDIKTGDLIFLIKKENSHKHVGIVEKNKDINLIHASLEKKKVIRQSLEKVFEGYDFVEARRIII